MTKELKRVPFKEFASNLSRFFKQVIDERRSVIVENDQGEKVVIQRLPDATAQPSLTEDDYRAFRSAFGGWAAVDTDALKKDISESRKTSRPRVDL